MIKSCIKIVIILSLFFGMSASASILEEKVENIIGQNDYNIHKSLITHLLKNEEKFLLNGKVKYYNLFNELQQNGLLNLRLDRPKDIVIEFKILNNNVKAYKILNDTMQSLGYRYFFTKSFEYNQSKELIWKIIFKAEYMLDPVELLKDLKANNCKILDVKKLQKDHWYYEIDFQDSIISRAIAIEKNEKVKFQKPLRAFFLSVDNIKELQVMSRNLNNWFPHIVFFDKDLNVKKVIKKNRVYKGVKIKVPEGTKYVKVTDLYNLINIKRGLTIIVR